MVRRGPAAVPSTQPTRRALTDDTLYFLSQRGWLDSSESFFDALCRFLCVELPIDYALIDEISTSGDSVHSVAFHSTDAMLEPIEYGLLGTPCATIIGKQLCVYPANIQRLFPDDVALQQLGVEAYLGTPLWDSLGRPIGLIALMSKTPMRDSSTVSEVLSLVAMRASGELERLRVESELESSELRFREMAANVPGVVFQFRAEADGSAAFSYLSPRASDLYGLSPDALQGDSFATLLERSHPDDLAGLEESINAAVRDRTPWRYTGRLVTPGGNGTRACHRRR